MGNEHTLVIGTVGRNGSGKDSLVNYLARTHHDVHPLSIGDVVRQLAEERAMPTTRESLHEVSQQLMHAEGPDVFIRRIIRQIEGHDWHAVAISGIRTPHDAEAFRQRFDGNFLLVHIEVGARTRYQRLKKRGEPRDPSTFEEFQRQERDEERQFHLGATIAAADLTIRNDGSPEEFHERIERQVVRPYLKAALR
jgi:dephospho-CoA kinase